MGVNLEQFEHLLGNVTSAAQSTAFDGTSDKDAEELEKARVAVVEAFQELRKALEPLAEKCESWMDDYPDEMQVNQEYTHFTYGELRQAVRAMGEGYVRKD